MMRCTILLPVLPMSLALLVAAAQGCSTGNGTQCFVGADCASGACSAAGQCVPAPAGDAGVVIGADGSVTESDGALLPSPEASLEDSPFSFPPPADDASACVPDGSGTITRNEVPMGVGLRATYLVADNATWDTTGTIGDAGTRTWDLTGALSGDRSVIFTALTPSGTWWASSYPAATFGMLLEASQTLLGVFQVGDESLSLIGIVSQTNSSPLTEVKYATPIPTLQFPFSLGSTWTTTSQVSGTVSGVTFAAPYSETYVTTVDAAGEMKTPFATFPVLRVATLLTQTVGFDVSYTQSFVWVAQCFGPVAAASAASSSTKPTSTEFSTDAEVRRLTN